MYRPMSEDWSAQCYLMIEVKMLAGVHIWHMCICQRFEEDSVIISKPAVAKVGGGADASHRQLLRGYSIIIFAFAIPFAN